MLVGAGVEGHGITGAMSCLQVFDEFLSTGRVKHYQHCHSATHLKVDNPCPLNYIYYDDMCYLVQMSTRFV